MSPTPLPFIHRHQIEQTTVSTPCYVITHQAQGMDILFFFNSAWASVVDRRPAITQYLVGTSYWASVVTTINTMISTTRYGSPE